MKPKRVKTGIEKDVAKLIPTTLTGREIIELAAKRSGMPITDKALNSNITVKNITGNEVLFDTPCGKISFPLVTSNITNQNSIQNLIYVNKKHSYEPDELVFVDNYTTKGEFMFGVPMNVLYMNFKGWGYEDALVINERVVTSGILHILDIASVATDIALTWTTK